MTTHASVEIRARGVELAYARDREVLRGIDIEVRAGELLALFGPNGSGKSTLLRVLSGELRPSAGEVELEGRPLAAFGPREIARRIAVVPQDTAAGFPYTVGELVLMGRAPHLGRLELEGEGDMARARAALDALELWPLRERRIDEISGGERSRAAIARALAQEPCVLLLDEPTAHLDVGHQLAVYRRLGDLERSGLAILAVSHDVNLAAQYATRVALLEAGKIRAIGTPEEVLVPALLSEVFGVEVETARHPRTGRPLLVFL